MIEASCPCSPPACWDGAHCRVGVPGPCWVWEAQPPGLCMGGGAQKKRPQALGGEHSDTSIQEGSLEGAALDREEKIEAHVV